MGLLYRSLADLLVAAHLAFILFVALGALLVLKWPRLAWLHVPCAIWGSVVELAGWVCPLTPLENHFRARAGLDGYAGGFIEHHVLPLVYPSGLTRGFQVALGLSALALNLAAYGWMAHSRARRRAGT